MGNPPFAGACLGGAVLAGACFGGIDGDEKSGRGNVTREVNEKERHTHSCPHFVATTRRNKSYNVAHVFSRKSDIFLDAKRKVSFLFA
jgi:hypothetical protein